MVHFAVLLLLNVSSLALTIPNKKTFRIQINFKQRKINSPLPLCHLNRDYQSILPPLIFRAQCVLWVNDHSRVQITCCHYFRFSLCVLLSSSSLTSFSSYSPSIVYNHRRFVYTPPCCRVSETKPMKTVHGEEGKRRANNREITTLRNRSKSTDWRRENPTIN